MTWVLNHLTELVWLVTAIYALVALGFGMQREWDQCLIFTGYSIANLGVMKVVQLIGSKIG